MAFDEKKKFDSEKEGKEDKESQEKQKPDNESGEYLPAYGDGSEKAMADTIEGTTSELADLKINIETGSEERETLAENIEKPRGGDEHDSDHDRYTQTDRGFAYRPQNIRQSEVREDMNPDEGRMASVNAVMDLRSEVRNKRFGLS